MTPADLRSMREGAGLTREALGALIERTEGTVYEYEVGRKRIAPSVAKRIREALDDIARPTPEAVAALRIEQARQRKLINRLEARLRALLRRHGTQGTAGEDGQG